MTMRERVVAVVRRGPLPFAAERRGRRLKHKLLLNVKACAPRNGLHINANKKKIPTASNNMPSHPSSVLAPIFITHEENAPPSSSFVFV
jgi:hypothetical protein